MGETMSVNKDHHSMTRRQALQGLVALVGGTVGVAELGPLAQAAMADTGATPRFLDADQFALLGRVVDLMIPDTDTPGAHEVGVHRFIDMMLADYAADDSRKTMLEALAGVNGAATGRRGEGFVALPAEDQFAVLAGVDKEAFENRAGSEPYRMLKSIILFGYYTSEVGASVELRFNPIPGTTPGCVPADTFDRAPYRAL